MSRKEEGSPAESFAAFLKHNLKLKTLFMRGEDSSALKLEILPILEALTTNDTLTSLDISGHQGGDSLATALGRQDKPSSLFFIIIIYLLKTHHATTQAAANQCHSEIA